MGAKDSAGGRQLLTSGSIDETSVTKWTEGDSQKEANRKRLADCRSRCVLANRCENRS